MYLTAQRITRPADGATAIHAFRHHHGREIGVSASWMAGEVMEIANHDPGNLTAKEVHLPQGGNSVLSYLDVVCEDETAAELIERVLVAFDVGEAIRRQGWFGPVMANQDGVAAVFSAGVAHLGQESIEYAELRAAVLRLILRT